MTAKMTILATTLWVTAAALPVAQAPVTKSNVVKVNGDDSGHRRDDSHDHAARRQGQ